MEEKKFTIGKMIFNKSLASLIFLVRIFIAFLFIYSALSKINSPMSFALSIDSYQIVPEWSVNFFAILIPWIELCVGFGILFKYKYKENLLLYTGLMFVFTAFVVIAMIKGLDIECGCFGESSSKVGLKKLLENIGIIILVVLLLVNELRQKKFSQQIIPA